MVQKSTLGLHIITKRVGLCTPNKVQPLYRCEARTSSTHHRAPNLYVDVYLTLGVEMGEYGGFEGLLQLTTHLASVSIVLYFLLRDEGRNQYKGITRGVVIFREIGVKELK